jgi:hypothetical protein
MRTWTDRSGPFNDPVTVEGLPARSAEELEAYTEQSNPFKEWFEDYCVVTGNSQDYIIREEFLAKHNDWLRRMGHKTISAATIARLLRQEYPHVNKQLRVTAQDPDGNFIQVRAWGGLRWK